MQRLASERVIAVGQTESGKTEFLARRFLPRQKRLLICDQTGEWFEREPGAPSAVGLGATVAMLREYAKRDRWRLVTTLSQSELIELSAALVGVPDIRSGFSYNVGGMALLLSEVDLVVPVTSAPEELRSLWRRGSHAGLSIYADTQKPSNVSKEVTSQCRWLVLLRVFEPADVTYVRNVIGNPTAVRALQWVTRTRWNAVLWDVHLRKGYCLTPEGKVQDRIPHGQDQLPMLEEPESE